MDPATAAAAAAAIVLAALGAVLLRVGRRQVLWTAVLTLCAVVMTTALGAVTGVLAPSIAISISIGAAPVGIALSAAARAADVPRVLALVAAGLWGGVLVPAALVGPQAAVRLCPPTTCVVSDFGGALALVVGLGAFLLVPASLIRMPDAADVAPRPRGVRLALALGAWAAFAVWLAALEGAVDEYTPRLLLAAVLAPAAGAIGWLLVDRIRGIDATLGRALRLGLLAGAGGVIGPVADIATPWTPLLGLICGIAGALTHDARGLARSRPAVRGAVTAIVVGAIGLASTGIIGQALGFVFAARVDVLGTQLLAVIGTIALGVLLSAPVTVLAGLATPAGREPTGSASARGGTRRRR
jgi:ammonium transporter, Amt family